MEEIKEFLINMYQSADEDTKRRIKILLKNEVVDYCKCPRCGEKFEPEEGRKSSILMYDWEEA